MKTFRIVTLGCKVNQAESDALSARLAGEGWRVAAAHEEADLCVVHTCAVTQKAAMQSRQAVRRAVLSHPRACVTVTGCYAETDPGTLAKIAGVDHVLDRGAAGALEDILQTCPEHVCAPSADPSGPCSTADRPRGRTRPFVKIQDGCDAFCAYCIVPYARGRSRSVAAGDVLESVRRLEAAGYHEAVLTGIHIGRYGQESNPPASLSGLLREIAGATERIRLRLSSIEPLELTPELIDIVAGSDRFCRHFHIPLQSGDAEVLQRMRRPYGPHEFTAAVARIHAYMPEAALGADILVGFPGESEQAFLNTYELVQSLPLSYLHVFPFSPRPGTAASALPDRVHGTVVKDRCTRMRRLGAAKRRAFYSHFIGREVADVVTESRRDPQTGLLKGVTGNYLPVLFAGGDEHMGCVRRVHLLSVSGPVLNGKLVGEDTHF